MRALKKSLEKFLDAARKVNPNAFEAWQCFGALQLAYQYAMMKAAVSASGSYGTCTICEVAFGTEDKEIVELCNKAFRQIFVLPWQGKSGK